MAHDRAPTAAKTRPQPGAGPVSRARRSLLALSPAALGAAGFFISGLRRDGSAAGAAGKQAASGAPSDEMTDHRKAYYDRARF